MNKVVASLDLLHETFAVISSDGFRRLQFRRVVTIAHFALHQVTAPINVSVVSDSRDNSGDPVWCSQRRFIS